MLSPNYRIQRDEDAGFFEDWTLWRNSYCWVEPLVRTRRYRLYVDGIKADRIVSGFLDRPGIPGARQQLKSRYHLHAGYWYIPAASWRQLWQRMPDLLVASFASGITRAVRRH